VARRPGGPPCPRRPGVLLAPAQDDAVTALRASAPGRGGGDRPGRWSPRPGRSAEHRHHVCVHHVRGSRTPPWEPSGCVPSPPLPSPPEQEHPRDHHPVRAVRLRQERRQVPDSRRADAPSRRHHHRRRVRRTTPPPTATARAPSDPAPAGTPKRPVIPRGTASRRNICRRWIVTAWTPRAPGGNCARVTPRRCVPRRSNHLRRRAPCSPTGRRQPAWRACRIRAASPNSSRPANPAEERSQPPADGNRTRSDTATAYGNPVRGC